MAKSRKIKPLEEFNIAHLARALSPPRRRQFCADVRVGTRTRQLICFAKSVLGAKRIAGRYYREMYPDCSVDIIAVTEI